MGEVYLCLNLETGTPLALKTFQERFLANQRVRELFKREVSTWISLGSHPHIVRCYLMETIEYQPFMHLEWIVGDQTRGVDLRKWMNGYPHSLRLGLDVAIDICRGLIHAGAKQPGIVHRDLKPENILIGADWVAKITDFALARISEEVLNSATAANKHVLTNGSLVAGTPPYMAPEQWRGETLDQRTDIYALGCILYEVLTGGFLFSGSDTGSIQQQHLFAAVPRLSGANASPALDQIISRCLAKRPDERYQAVADLLVDLSTHYLDRFQSAPRVIPENTPFKAADYLVRAATYGQLGRYDRALADVDRALELDPHNPHIHYIRGIIHNNTDRHQEAIEDFNRTLEIDSGMRAAYGERAHSHFRLSQFAEAIQDYDRAIELNPNNGNLYLNRGSAHAGLQNYNLALADLDRGIKLDPKNFITYYVRGTAFVRLQDHIEVLTKLYGEELPVNSILAPRRFLTNDNHCREELSRLALADFTTALLLDPLYGPAYLDRAFLHSREGVYQPAISDFSMAIKLGERVGSAYTGRGTVYEAFGKFNEAIADFTHAIELDAENTEAYRGRAEAYAKLQQHQRAVADLSYVLSRQPTSKAFYNRGRSRVYHKDYRGAMDDYDHAIELSPTFAMAYNNRGYVHELEERFAAALDDYDRALKLEPAQVLTYLNRGNTFDKMSRITEALNDYRKAAELDPVDPGPWKNMGATYGSRSAIGHALPYLDRAGKLGDEESAQSAMRVRQQLNLAPGELANPFQLAFEAIQLSNSAESMRATIEQHPIIKEFQFLETLERVLDEQIPDEKKPQFLDRLGWILDIVNEDE